MFPNQKLSIVLTAAALMLALFFGLNPRGFQLANNVSWISGRNGIRFGKYGIAYANHIVKPIAHSEPEAADLSIEIALTPASLDDNNFKFILVFHGGHDASQLLVGNWRSSVIVMNGDDYDGSRRLKKLGATDALSTQVARLVTVTSGKEGTRIYVDGKIAAAAKDLHLRFPAGGEGVRLVVGNSVYGRHFWSGDLFGLAVYDTALSETEIKSHFEKWSVGHQFVFDRQSSPRDLFVFDEKKGGRVRNRAEGGIDIEIPRRFKILKKEILDASWRGIRLNSSFVQDVLLNIAGFMPLGFLLNALFAGLGYGVGMRSLVLTITCCFILSLSIEIAQTWMPSRSSQLIDLLMNTSGAFAGAAISQYSMKRDRVQDF